MVRVDVHGIPQGGRMEVTKPELTLHISQQVILHNQNEMLVDVFKRLNLMVQLDERCFGRHFPIYAEGLGR